MGLDLRRRTILFTLVTALAPAAALPDSALFVVDSADDAADSHPGDGVCATASGCTLRAAIQEANALAGLDHIAFAIGSGERRISVSSALPTITDPVIIDGSTQPGFAGTPIVELDGSGAKSEVDGLTITGGGSTIRGLVINGFSGNGVVLGGSVGNVLEGNYIGTDVAGTTAIGNGNAGVLIEGANNRIGGTTAAARNVISGNQGNGVGGIMLSGSGAAGNTVQGNYIGTDATGMAPLGNTGRGVAIKGAPNNLIGGSAPGAGNVISGNRASGIRIFGGATGNEVRGNLIGSDRNGTPHYGVLNNGRGVQIRSDANVVAGNLITSSWVEGVVFVEAAANNVVQGNVVALNYIGISNYQGGNGNRFVGNSVFANLALGIDLAPLGMTSNDVGDSDDGPNGLQNFPVLSSATRSGAMTTISGALNGTGSAAFTLEFFANPQCDPSGYGEGLYPLGQRTVTTDPAGDATFSVGLGVAVPAGWVVTATATDAGGNTSEFSACVTVR
jgi:CSLREA domain-containing protein